MSRVLRFAAIVCVLGLIGLPAMANTEFVPVGIKVRQSWIEHQTNKTLDDAPVRGFIDNPEALAKLWKAWRADALPQVDFSKEIVLVLTAPENAAVMLTATRDDKGVIRVTNRSTQRRSVGMTYVIAIVDRAGINAVGDSPVPAPK